MSSTLFAHFRQAIIAAVAAAGAILFAATGHAQTSLPPEANAVRPFSVNVPQQALDDLRRRIAMTRWPDQETVSDRSQGVQLARLQDLVRYWGSRYDWRKAET